MNVLYDRTIFALQEYGGIKRYFFELSGRIKAFSGVSVEFAPGAPFFKKIFAIRRNLFIDLKIKQGKVNIYHPTYYSRNILKRSGVKTVVTIFDMIHELYFTGIKNFANDLKMKKQAIDSADHIICISHATKNDLMRLYAVPEHMISVVYLGAPETSNMTANVYNSQVQNKPYFLYIGKRDGYKNFKQALRVFGKMHLDKDFDLLCLGGGNFNPEEINDFGKVNLLKAIRHVSGNDQLLVQYYRKAVALIYPSLYEGFGLPVLEAMACGCPVISSRAASIPEVAGDAALLFTPEDDQGLESRIKELLSDDSLRSRYIQRGLERSKDFSWEKMTRETFTIYQKLMVN